MKIILKEKEYFIPESWNDITLEKYQKTYGLLKEIKEEESTDFDKLFHNLKIISYYLDIPIEVLKTEKISVISEIIENIRFLFEPIPDKQVVEFEFNEETYYVMQSLMESQFQDYVSLENVLQFSDLVEVLHLVMAIMSRKKDETLDDYDVNKRSIEFKQLDMVTVHNISVFFCLLGKNYTVLSQLYSHPKEVLEAKIKEVENSMTVRDGTGWFTTLQTGITKKLFYYFIKRLRKSYTSIHRK